MAGQDEENYLDNLLNSIESENSADAAARAGNGLDFDEVDLSDSDMERLANMDLDNIIDQVTTDSNSVADLFHGIEELGDDMSVPTKRQVKEAEEATRRRQPADNEQEAETLYGAASGLLEVYEENPDYKKKRKKEKKQKPPKEPKEKRRFLDILKDVLLEDVDEDDPEFIAAREAEEAEKPKKKKEKVKKEKPKKEKNKKEKNAQKTSTEAPVESAEDILDAASSLFGTGSEANASGVDSPASTGYVSAQGDVADNSMTQSDIEAMLAGGISGLNAAAQDEEANAKNEDNIASADVAENQGIEETSDIADLFGDASSADADNSAGVENDVSAEKTADAYGVDEPASDGLTLSDEEAAALQEVVDATGQSAEREADENERLIQEVYGDKDHLDDNEAPKKGFFAKLIYRIKQMAKKNKEEDALEEAAEEAEAEEKRQKKEEKKAAAAEKKEAAKKEKEKKAKEKQAKPKKEKKPKPPKKPKPEPKPGDILKIKPKSMILFVLFVASVCVFVTLFNNVAGYSSAVTKAKWYVESGDYKKAYNQLSGLKLNKNDTELYQQVVTVYYVRRQLESYENYKNMHRGTDAIHALITGLRNYDEKYEDAKEKGVSQMLDEDRILIYEKLQTECRISEQEANALKMLADKDFVTYYKQVEAYGRALIQ